MEGRLQRPVGRHCILTQGEQDGARLPVPPQVGSGQNTERIPGPTTPKTSTPSHVHPNGRRDRVLDEGVERQMQKGRSGGETCPTIVPGHERPGGKGPGDTSRNGQRNAEGKERTGEVLAVSTVNLSFPQEPHTTRGTGGETACGSGNGRGP